MTDREFEKMLQISSDDENKSKKKKRSRRPANRCRKEEMTKAELVKGAQDDNGGYEVSAGLMGH